MSKVEIISTNQNQAGSLTMQNGFLPDVVFLIIFAGCYKALCYL